MAIKQTGYCRKSHRQSGFALIFVLVFMATIISITAGVFYLTTRSVKRAQAEHDILLARTAARTGLEFAKFVIQLNKLAEPYQNNPVVPLPKRLFTVLNGVPLGADVFDKISGATNSVPLDKILPPELKEALAGMKGYFVLRISTENTRLNLNLLQNIYAGSASKSLLRLFSSPDMAKVLDLYGIKPNQLVSNLQAYIKASSINGPLDNLVLADYNRLGLAYGPKHGALESLDELRRVPGFEKDDLYNLLLDYVTIWPVAALPNSLNINEAPTALVASLISPEHQEPETKIWDAFDDYRQKNTFSENTIKPWFQANLPSYATDSDADDIRKNLFGVSNVLFRVECTGFFKGVSQPITVVLKIADAHSTNTGSKASGSTTSDSGSATASGTTSSAATSTSGQSAAGSGTDSTAAGASGSSNTSTSNSSNSSGDPSGSSNTPAKGNQGTFDILYSQGV